MEPESYHSVRYYCFDAIQAVIKKIEESSSRPKCPSLTPLEKRMIDKLREENDDPTFWF
jgi:hypothetical protein